jgi:hypothetical protein
MCIENAPINVRAVAISEIDKIPTLFQRSSRESARLSISEGAATPLPWPSTAEAELTCPPGWFVKRGGRDISILTFQGLTLSIASYHCSNNHSDFLRPVLSKIRQKCRSPEACPLWCPPLGFLMVRPFGRSALRNQKCYKVEMRSLTAE